MLFQFEDMDAKTNRRLNLQRLIETRFSGNSGKCADEIGIKRPQLSRWITDNATARQGIAEDSARKIEQRLGLQPGDLDKEETDLPAESPPPEASSAHRELIQAWELLTQEQRQNFMAQIQKRVDENREIYEQMAPPAVTRRTVRAGNPVNVFHDTSVHKRRKDDAN